MLHLSAGGPVCVNGRVVSACGERVWGYVRNLDWCYQDSSSLGNTLSRCCVFQWSCVCVVSASGERMSGVTYVTWTGVIKTVRLWIALCQDDTSFGSVCEWEGCECIW